MSLWVAVHDGAIQAPNASCRIRALLCCVVCHWVVYTHLGPGVAILAVEGGESIIRWNGFWPFQLSVCCTRGWEYSHILGKRSGVVCRGGMTWWVVHPFDWSRFSLVGFCGWTSACCGCIFGTSS